MMRLLEAKPDASQRYLAQELGISVGAVNYCLKALGEKGWVKLKNFAHSQHKLGYAYILTPSGIAAKAQITHRFLARKLDEYAALQVEIAQLQNELERSAAAPQHLPS